MAIKAVASSQWSVVSGQSPNDRPLPTDHGQRINRGFTLLELIITLGILAIIVAGVIPMMKNSIKRQREMELKRSLRDIRQALDRYQKACANDGLVGPLDRKVDDECYPTTLEVLVDGIHPPNSTRTIRFLRRLPVDPMTGKAEWGLRSMYNEKDDTSWDGKHIFDVYSKSEGTALNGTKYKDW
jgi:general secretion pathway protein G